MTDWTLLVARDVAIARGARRLVSGLSFSLGRGEALVLTGPNGVGKTSLLRAVAGLVRPLAGTLEARLKGGQAIASAALARSDGHLIGQADGLAPGRSGRGELAFLTAWNGGAMASALETATALGLARALDLPTRKLSAGQRRRLALIRLVAAPRSLWLLDEPLNALDANARAWLGETMRSHLARGGAILAASHEPLPAPARELGLA
jgi:heme exporter protein A